MKIAVGTIEINDKQREGLALELGLKGKADRETVKSMLNSLITSWLQDLEAEVTY